MCGNAATDMRTGQNATAETLRFFVRAVERAVELRTPIPPEVLAVLLGLDVHDGARSALRLRPATGGGVVTVDSTTSQAAQDAFIARACASYLLRRAGMIKSSINVGELAAALCG